MVDGLYDAAAFVEEGVKIVLAVEDVLCIKLDAVGSTPAVELQINTAIYPLIGLSLIHI